MNNSSVPSGLSWGASAVEMGLNRMSALGMGKALTKSQADVAGQAFVAFKNGTLPSVPKQDDSLVPGQKKSGKKFGF